MSLALEYRNTRADHRTHYELIENSSYLASRRAYYKSLAFWGGVLLLSLYAAFRADMIYLMFLLLVAGGWSVVRAFPFSRWYWAAVERTLATRPETHIRLMVEEDGLHETVEGIESFVPWGSVKGFRILRDTLFIELTGGLWSIVPRGSVSTNPADYDALIAVLRSKGIPEARISRD